MDSLQDILNKIGYESNTPVNETEEEKKQREREYVEQKCEMFNKEEGNLNEKDGYNCPVCKNKGGIMAVSDNDGIYSEVYRPCKCMKARSMIAKLERSGLKNIIKDYSFDKYQETEEWQRQLKQTALKFINDDTSTWFFIGGMSGVGKTHLCTAIAAHYLRQNKAVRYMLWRDEITSIKAIINDSEKYRETIDELKKVEVLYIDDLFKMGKDNNGEVQRPTVSDVNIAFEILNYRYNNKELITIISSERTMHDLIAIDEALGGRISEMTVPNGFYIGIKYDPKKNYRTKGIVEI